MRMSESKSHFKGHTLAHVYGAEREAASDGSFTWLTDAAEKKGDLTRR